MLGRTGDQRNAEGAADHKKYLEIHNAAASFGLGSCSMHHEAVEA